MSPRGGPCNHRECQSWGEGCRQLTDDELRPGPDDFTYVDQLIAEGYYQTSARYRSVAGPLSAIPSAETVLRPEFLDTKWGRELARIWEGWRRHFLRVHEASDGIQNIDLTVKQFAAFKQRGGKVA